MLCRARVAGVGLAVVAPRVHTPEGAAVNRVQALVLATSDSYSSYMNR